MWATAEESRRELVDRYRQAWALSHATIAARDIHAPGHVPWWPRPDVQLFNILVHVLTETARHAGHADVLREQLDGAVGSARATRPGHGRSAAFWDDHRARIEQAAQGADPHHA
jgi:hypothetical protein